MRIDRQGDARPASWLAASWARAHIRDLEDRYAIGAANNRDREQTEQAIVRTSKHFSVLSRFTAFLAVDGTQVVNPGGNPHPVVQAVERTRAGAVHAMPMAMAMPAPWSPASAPPPTMMIGGGGMAPDSTRRQAPSAPVPSYSSRASFAEPAPAPPTQVTSLDRLGQLAHELAAAREDVAAVRAWRFRLTAWLEEVRLRNTETALVAAVEALLQPLYAALATGTNLGAIVTTIAAELAKLATGQPAPPPRPTSRWAFWK